VIELLYVIYATSKLTNQAIFLVKK